MTQAVEAGGYSGDGAAVDSTPEAWLDLALCQGLRDMVDRPEPEEEPRAEHARPWHLHKQILQSRFDSWRDESTAPEYDSALKVLIAAALNLVPPTWLAEMLACGRHAFAGGADLIESPMPATPAQPTEQ